MSTGVPVWVADPALATFWARVADRLETTGRTARGRLTVEAATREERHALGALLGRSLTRDRVQVDLADLDARLAERTDLAGLADAASVLVGRPLRDRPAEKADLAARREEPLLIGRRAVAGPWVDEWLADLRRTGLLTRRADATESMTQAITVLGALLPEPAGPVSRVELGARLLGDAHALDDGRVLSQVVLRALAAAAGAATPTSSAERRALWQRYSVSGDRVSTTCLTVGLRPQSGDHVSGRLLDATGGGFPIHLTAWDLRGWSPRTVLPRDVLVCENPRVLEAVAEAAGGAVAVVCAAGEPNTVVTAVLDRLLTGGCRLRYHGDFDWPGVAITNRLVARHDVRPWRMGVADYEAGLHPRALPLGEPPVEPGWDAELGPAMRAHGVAVHEEAVLEHLVPALLA